MVAEYFGKRHCDVLRAISKLDCSADFHQRNFAYMVEMKELPQGGKTKSSYYFMTRDGFTFLAMGFTGKVAAKFKEAYINAFNEMERIIQENKSTVYAEKLIEKEVKSLNSELKYAASYIQEKYGSAYGSYGEIRTGLFFNKKMQFEEKIHNLFNQVHSAYIEAFFLSGRYRTLVDENNRLKKLLTGLSRNLAEEFHILPE
jgi:Rha family phage regulatory protein